MPPPEHDYDARMAHQTEEPVAEHTEEPVVHQKEASERLSEKTESRGQSPETKKWELKKTMRMYEYQAHQTSDCNAVYDSCSFEPSGKKINCHY